MFEKNGMHQNTPPVVLVCAGADPSGGAGIQADIQTLTALGCHVAPVITAITVQDTQQVYHYQVLTAEWVVAQIEAVLADMQVVAVKLGMLGSVQIVEAIGKLFHNQIHLPLVLDPVLATETGKSLAKEGMIGALNRYLLPYTELLTPNIPEAAQLSGNSGPDLDKQAKRLLDQGCHHVLITGTHAPSTTIQHRLYCARTQPKLLECPRLAGTFHGTGCTLASAITAGIAQGLPVLEAVYRAQAYTLQSLESAFKPGRGQWIPNRGVVGSPNFLRSPKQGQIDCSKRFSTE